MSFNYTGVPNPPMPPMLSGMGMPGPMMPGPQMTPQGFMGPMMTGQAPGPADPAQFTMPNMILPGMNDNPLEFNINKNKPPMPISIDSSTSSLEESSQKSNSPSDRTRRRGDKRDRDRDRRDEKEKRDDRDKDNNSGSNPSPTDNLPTQSNLTPNMWGGVVGMGYSVMGMNMIMDPNMMGMNNYSMMQPMMSEGTIMPQQDPAMLPQSPLLPSTPIKEIIHCKSCTLFPPNPNAPPPTTRERPPGCRTVFVGGLPENITEDIIMEVFERCGEITTLRLSKKNFCHIRFVYEEYVDHAIFLSGYRIRIGSNTDAANNGRLHVDYAQARDDQYEWECRQRQLQREQRHRERMEEERMRPPSPPPVVHYTDHEASSVSEKIKQDESFSKAVQIVITWLERGDCSKRNSNTFYSMIQSTNSHVRRLLSEKTQYEEELQKAKEIMKGRMQGILIQFGQIERVFSAACHKKCWDHFTKAQRKNIEMWRKQSMEIKTIQLEDALNERADDEMDVSDEEDNSCIMRKRPRNNDTLEQERSNLKDENDSLRCQLEAYKNEVDLVRNDMKAEVENKDKQLKMLQHTLQGMQQQLIESRRKQSEEENKVRVLEQQRSSEKLKNLLDGEPTIIDLDGVDSVKSNDSPVPIEMSRTESSDNTQATPQLSDRDAKLIGVISTFLHVHPFGAGVDYVWSYVHKLEPSLKPADVENLMTRFPAVFRQELSGIGANMERRWQFNGFNNVSDVNRKN